MIVILFLLLAIGAFAQPSLTTVTDTLYSPVDNVRLEGTIKIELVTGGATSSGSHVFGSRTITISNGALSVTLPPTTTMLPSGAYYRVTKSLRPAGVRETAYRISTVRWNVPTSATCNPCALDDIESLTLPSPSGSVSISTLVSPCANGGVLEWSGVEFRCSSVPLVNPMTTAGDIIYGGGGGSMQRLAGNTSGTKQFLTMTSSLPSWGTIAADDLPSGIDAAKLTGTFTGSVVGNASTASALAANPSPCPDGQYVTDVAANGTLTCAAMAGAGGTVTSVGLSLPGIFSVSDSPVTSAGTISASLQPQAANTLLAGPSSGGSAIPGFRALAAADVPQAAVTQHQAALSVGWGQLTGIPSTFTPSSHNHAASEVTSGTFADARIALTAVTQYQASLAIGWPQLTGVPSTFTPSAHNHAASEITSGTLDDARVAASNVTQHQAALSIAWGQITGVPAFRDYVDVVLDYGADPTGASDSSAAFQNAIDSGASVIAVPRGEFLLNTTLDITNRANAPITILGSGRTQYGYDTTNGSTNGGTVLLGNTDSFVLDTTGSQFVTLQDFLICASFECTDKTLATKSKFGILMARSATSQYAQFHVYSRLTIFLETIPAASSRGSIGIYNVAAEHFTANHLYLIADAPLAVASTDVLSLPSPYAGALSGPASMSVCSFNDLALRAWTSAGAEFWGASSIELNNILPIRQAGSTAPAAYVFNTLNQNVTINGGQVEDFPSIAKFSGDTSGVRIRTSIVSPSAPLIVLDSGVDVDGSLDLYQINTPQTLFSAAASSSFRGDIRFYEGGSINDSDLSLFGNVVFAGTTVPPTVTVNSASKYFLNSAALSRFTNGVTLSNNVPLSFIDVGGSEGFQIKTNDGVNANAGVINQVNNSYVDVLTNNTFSTRFFQSQRVGIGTTTDDGVNKLQVNGSVAATGKLTSVVANPGAVVFASLPGSPTNGDIIYCSDCAQATPCAGSGSGALARRINGAWDCGGGSAGTANPSTSFTGQTSITFTHNLNTLNVLIQCYDGSDNAIAYNGLTLSSVNAAAITFSAAQTGRCVANGTGGGGGGGGATQLTDLSDVTAKQGDGTVVPMYAGSAPSTNDCAKFDANGNLTTAGAACGTGGASLTAGTGVDATALAADEVAIDQDVVAPKPLTFTHSHDFGSISSGSYDTVTVSGLTGIQAGDSLIVSANPSLADGVFAVAKAQATNGEVKIQVYNMSGSSNNPDSATFRITKVVTSW